MKMEDGHNQPIISPKRIKLRQITENEEEDRMSELPDCLLLEILSRLPSTKEAIKTGTLSKRWKDLWTLISTLIFKYDSKISPSEFVSFVDLTFTQCRQVKLKKFLVYATFYYGFKRQVNKWIRYAITCNVEDLCLALYGGDDDEFQLDQSLFINTCLTHLKLGGCMLNPIGAISWKNLRSLCISCGDLNEDLIENILSGSPLLETLVLKYCFVKYRLNITSKSIKNLEMNYCHGREQPDLDYAEVIAPNIFSLTIKGKWFLSDFLLVNMSSLVEAYLDCKNATPTEEEEDMLIRFIMNLRHVKELKIGGLCSQVLSRLEAKGFVLPSNVKFPDGF